MVDFIQALLPNSCTAHFIFHDREPEYRCITGLATDSFPVPFPHRVELWLTKPGARQFPAWEQYVPELPMALLMNHSEEILLVLAHELRHVHQFNSSSEFPSGSSLEPDAEQFAYQALFLWRQQHPQRRCRLISRKQAA